jgi:ubiquinone/menaquinone biosynthesis C-methylase UbiE
MKTRGEKQYIRMPFMAARMYDNLTRVRGVNRSFEEISVFLESFLRLGRILDVGTGPGRLLFEINKRIPLLELFGLDISAAMLEIAEQNLKDIQNKDLRIGNIIHTDYPNDFFDCIVSSGSFYNWDKPVEGLDEIFRILKAGKTAYIFESNKNYDKELLKFRLHENLQGCNFIRRTLSKYFLRKQLRMTYSTDEFEHIIKQTKFKASYNIRQIELGNLPVYVRLELRKE